MERRMLAMERRLLPMERRMLAMERGLLAMERGLLTMERGLLPMEQELLAMDLALLAMEPAALPATLAKRDAPAPSFRRHAFDHDAAVLLLVFLGVVRRVEGLAHAAGADSDAE